MKKVLEKDITFIIPAYNEEFSLPRTLESIIHNKPESLTYEIIVADNGSKDNTIKIAQSYNAIVVVDELATVGGLRNRAAKIAHGQVLVFLDADVSLTRTWRNNINEIYQSLIENPLQVTGSRCGIPRNASWIEQYWFEPLLQKETKYINSGHLITARKLFNAIGGFDESLESGEDYVFGVTASNVGATIKNNPQLAVVHEGYPKTLFQFIRREIWHGRGDCKSFRAIMASSVAILSSLFVGLHMVLVYSLLFYSNQMLSISVIALIAGVCVFFSIYRHNAKTLKSILIVSALYYFYLVSRFISCIPII